MKSAELAAAEIEARLRKGYVEMARTAAEMQATLEAITVPAREVARQLAANLRLLERR